MHAAPHSSQLPLLVSSPIPCHAPSSWAEPLLPLLQSFQQQVPSSPTTAIIVEMATSQQVQSSPTILQQVESKKMECGEPLQLSPWQVPSSPMTNPLLSHDKWNAGKWSAPFAQILLGFWYVFNRVNIDQTEHTIAMGFCWLWWVISKSGQEMPLWLQRWCACLDFLHSSWPWQRRGVHSNGEDMTVMIVHFKIYDALQHLCRS